MAILNELRCTVCRQGDTPLDQSQIEDLLSQIPEWILFIEDGSKKIRRRFGFNDFSSAMEFSRKVGVLAEQEGHHPDIHTGWGYATIIWWTHKIEGLHKNDFIMAAKTDEIFTDFETDN